MGTMLRRRMNVFCLQETKWRNRNLGILEEVRNNDVDAKRDDSGHREWKELYTWQINTRK